MVRAPDARYEGFELGALHWDFARALLDAVPPAEDDTVRHWYRTIAAHFAGQYAIGEAVPHLEHARKLLPADAAILFSSGCLQETLAAPRIQEFVRATLLPNGRRILDVSSERTHLRRAEALFRQALKTDPDLVEARLRLGRVIGLSGRHKEAAFEIGRVEGKAFGCRRLRSLLLVCQGSVPARPHRVDRRTPLRNRTNVELVDHLSGRA